MQSEQLEAMALLERNEKKARGKKRERERDAKEKFVMKSKESIYRVLE